MKSGLTLLEMLVVIGIIAILTGASIAGYSHILRVGENARARELVAHAATALTALFDNDGVWPKAIRNKGARGGRIDEYVAYCLRKNFSVNVDATSEKTIGYDRFGIVTPWAQTVIKRHGTTASLSTKVNGSSTIQDHILYFAVDLDGDGIIEASQNELGVEVRATAIVWCCDKDGKVVDYSTGAKKDGIYSWSYGQTQSVK